MTLFTRPMGPGGLWLGPVLAGAVLILIGIALYVWPALLAYVVAGVFVAGGLSLMTLGWRMRRQVTYRPMHGAWRIEEDDRGGGVGT